MQRSPPVLTSLFCFVLVWFIAMETAVAEKPDRGEELVFGFLPILSTQRLVARFGPLTDYLAQKLGKKVRLETAPNYAEFVQRTRNGRYDILFTAPHFLYMAQRQGNYQVLVRVDAPSLHALIVAPKDGNIRRLEDLKGKRLATVDPLALGTVLVRAHLAAHGIDPDRDLTLVATPTHNASLLSAYKGVTDAASLMVPPFKRARPEVRESMRVLGTTQGTPHMPVAVATRMASADVEILRQSFLTMKQSEAGRALLKRLGWPGFAAARAEEYEQLDWAAGQIRIKE